MTSQRVDISDGTAGAVNYKGTWNPATNVPPLGNSGAGGVKGDYYTCSIDGTTSIDGISTWYAGDKIVNNGTVWEKVEGQADDVRSFNGRYGDVVAATSDYDASQIDNDSSVSGATVKDALNTLAAPPGGVSSFNLRTGPVVSESGDYSADQITTDQTGQTVQDELNNRLKRLAGDFNSFTQKAPAVSNDILLLEDSADSYNKKKVHIADLPFGAPPLSLKSSTNIYLATTGSDTSGDGSSGNPYFSPHRALKDFYGVYPGTVPALIWAAGTYDYSTLSDLVVDLKVLSNAAYTGSAQWGTVSPWTVFDTGTFSAQTDTNSNRHTDGSKSWTPDALVGKFLHVTSMNTGSLPSAGNSVSFPRYVPIIKNTATTIETAFFGTGVQSQDVGGYEIVDHAVVLNFGAKNIQFLHTSFGILYWFGVKVTTTGDVAVSESTSSYSGTQSTGLYPVFNNSNIQCHAFEVGNGETTQTFIKHSSYSDFNWVRNGAIQSTNNPTTNSRITVRRWSDSVHRNSAGATTGCNIWFSATDQGMIQNRLESKAKFYNCAAAFSGERIIVDAKIYLDTINFLYIPYLVTGNNVFTGANFSLINEPAVGRITFDGTTLSTNYFDLDAGNNFRSLQPNTLPGHFAQTNIGGMANKSTNKTGATSVIGTVVSPNNLTTISIAGDTGGQLSVPSIIGVKFSNSNASAGLEGITELYWTLINTTGTRTFSLYKESTHTNLVARGTLVGDGVLTFTQQNSSGISGAITVTYTADDTDASNTFRCPIESAVINTPAGAHTYIGVITEVVSEGSQVFVARTGTALVLLEDGQSCNVGDFCIISPLVNGRARATNSMPLSMIGFFEESKASGTNVTARVSLRLDNASYGTIYATSVATSIPATSVQDEIDKFNSKTPNDRVSCGIRGTSITTGHKAWITMGYDGSFTGWEVTADAAGSIKFDIGKTNYASFPTVSLIGGSEPPTLVSQTKNQNLTLSSWTKTFSKGDRIEILIVSISGIVETNLTLYTKRF